MPAACVIVDLGFGDAGKGSIVDYLAQTQAGQAIVRYTGGPHAAHHVVTPHGASHAFCQFGASFKPGVKTHLARNMLVKPENLLYEGHALQSKGCPDVFERLSIDPACRVVTSFHAMLCQMKEIGRGPQRHGTVGIGAGEAVLDSQHHPEQALQVGDLYDPPMIQTKLCRHYEQKCRAARALVRECADPRVREELGDLYKSFTQRVRLKNVLALYRMFVQQLPHACHTDAEQVAHFQRQPGLLIFEGAHAALLDYTYGYFPYVTKTDTTVQEARRLLAQAGLEREAITLGVVRALGYRHGPGPFVTECGTLAQGIFEERHNKANPWQGQVRYGWFDLLAIRHGIALNAPVDGLALTMLDHLARLDSFQVCRSYEYTGCHPERLEQYFDWTAGPGGRIIITAIKKTPNQRSDELARLLFDCCPWEWRYFKRHPIQASSLRSTSPLPAHVWDFIQFLESGDGLGLPVKILSYGPTVNDKVYR